MKNHATKLIESILSRNDLSITLDKSDPKCETENKLEIVIHDKTNKYNRVWLRKSDDSTDRMKYDRIFLTFETGEEYNDKNLFYGILLNYIKEEKLFDICCENEDGETIVLFKIPNFSNEAELQIKLDMM